MAGEKFFTGIPAKEGTKVTVVKENIIRTSLEQLRQQSSSDFAALGIIDSALRKLSWSYAKGSVSNRTLQVVQKTTGGLTGTVIRSGRPSKSHITATESERFKLGEPLVLTEKLDTTVTLPVFYAEQIAGIVLLGRRFKQNYELKELDIAYNAAEQLAGVLFQ